MAIDNGFPDWDPSDTAKSLTLLYKWTVKTTESRIAWYDGSRKPKRAGSQWLRVFSILFAAIGALCPLIDATKIFGDEILLGQWGYVSIALAAAIVGYDKYFGLSTGWMRYIVTQLSLEKALKGFQYDWIILNAQEANTSVLIQRIKDFSLQVESLVKQETDAWVLEFQSNVTELEKVLKTEVDTRKPGNIKITVTNATDFDFVTIKLNDSPVKELIGVTEGLIDTVPPKRYEVTAIGKKGNKESKGSKVIEVQPSSMASVEITLPVP
jgi:hypothetical protein